MADRTSSFTSDKRTREAASWDSDQDWEAGVATNVEIAGGSLISRVSTSTPGPSQSQWETEAQSVQDWWNDNWAFSTDNSSATRDLSFVPNRFGIENAIELHVDEWTGARAWYETTAFDLSNYTTLHVHGQGRVERTISDQELEIYVAGNLEFSSAAPGWQEINIDITGYNSYDEIRLGYFNDRGSNEQGTYAEFYLE